MANFFFLKRISCQLSQSLVLKRRLASQHASTRFAIPERLMEKRTRRGTLSLRGQAFQNLGASMGTGHMLTGKAKEFQRLYVIEPSQALG
jgi:hypothetical protein